METMEDINYDQAQEKLGKFIDFKLGKVYLGRDHDVFLKRFVEIDLQIHISHLQQANVVKNYGEIIRTCDSLQSASAYVGAKVCQILAKSILSWARLSESTQISLEIAKPIEHSDKLEPLAKDYL